MRGTNISVDLFLFVLLYNTNFTNKLCFVGPSILLYAFIPQSLDMDNEEKVNLVKFRRLFYVFGGPHNIFQVLFLYFAQMEKAFKRLV